LERNLVNCNPLHSHKSKSKWFIEYCSTDTGLQ